MEREKRLEGKYVIATSEKDFSAQDAVAMYKELMEVERSFRNLKDVLALRPIDHRRQSRVEAHIFVAFLAYCLLVTLKHRVQAYAPGLTPRALLEKLANLDRLDVCLPTTDRRWLVLPRYTEH